MWTFNEQEANEANAGIPAGDHRVRISEMEARESKNGRDMYEIVLDVSGTSMRLYDYLVFMEDNSQMTNAKIGQLKNSFGLDTSRIDPKNAPLDWIGKTGAVRVKHQARESDGELQPRVSYYLKKDKQTNLPEWKEPARKAQANPNAAPSLQPPPLRTDVHIDDSDLPFDIPN